MQGLFIPVLIPRLILREVVTSGCLLSDFLGSAFDGSKISKIQLEKNSRLPSFLLEIVDSSFALLGISGAQIDFSTLLK